MLSFYDFLNLLDESNGPDKKSIADDLRAQFGQKPAQVEPANPVRSNTPATYSKPQTGNVALPKPQGTPDYDINDPQSPNYKPSNQVGMKPSSSKAMANYANAQGRQVASDENLFQKFNEYLGSITYRGLTALAVMELADQDPWFSEVKVPIGRFRLTAGDAPVNVLQVNDQKRGIREVNVKSLNGPVDKLKQIIHKVYEYLNTFTKDSGIGKSKSFLQALVSRYEQPGMADVVLRAIQFERAMGHPDIAGTYTTVENLANLFARKIKGAGMRHKNPQLDVAALKYLIDTAKGNGFDFFEYAPDSDEGFTPATPIRVKPISENIPKSKDDEDPFNRKARPKADDRLSGLNLSREHTEWMELMELLG